MNKNMRIRKFIPRNGAAILLMVGLTAFVYAAPASAGASDAASKEAGAKIFSDNCVPCHGEDGTGNTSSGKLLGAANLTTAKVQNLSNATLAHVIAEGKGQMPPFKSVLTHAQIQDVLKYVREFGKKKAPQK
ncbi:MAG: c-type cytochrome [Candidatus Acidiferrales bacterium]